MSESRSLYTRVKRVVPQLYFFLKDHYLLGVIRLTRRIMKINMAERA